MDSLEDMVTCDIWFEVQFGTDDTDRLAYFKKKLDRLDRMSSRAKKEILPAQVLIEEFWKKRLDDRIEK